MLTTFWSVLDPFGHGLVNILVNIWGVLGFKHAGSRMSTTSRRTYAIWYPASPLGEIFKNPLLHSLQPSRPRSSPGSLAVCRLDSSAMFAHGNPGTRRKTAMRELDRHGERRL